MPNATSKHCFVVQGFGEKVDYRTGRKLNLDASYDVIKGAVESAGLTCIRADEIQHSQVIDKPMYEHILEADLVIADLSTSNVNAAYELGVRHALRPATTIIVAEKGWDFAFDVDRNVIRTYEHLGPDIGRREAIRFATDLTSAIVAILAQQNAVDSPLYTFLPALRPPTLEAERALGALAYDDATPLGPAVKTLTDQAREALRAGDFATAKTCLAAARAIRPNDESVVQKLAFATYKSKQPDELTALREAHDMIRDTLDPGDTNDPETLGLWAAVHKRLWDKTTCIDHLEAGIDALERGFHLRRDYYNGINLAFLLNQRAALGDRPRPEQIADFVQAQAVRRKVVAICEALLQDGPGDPEQRYWVLASRWEAAVGLGPESDAARSWEAAARRHAAEKALPGWMLRSTEEQIDRLRASLDPSPLRFVLEEPPVA